MPNNPWLAVDATTSPERRARISRRMWDDFLGNGRIDSVRRPIAESWQRSQAAGLDPFTSRAPTVFGDRDDLAQRWEAHPLSAAAPLIRELLGAVADESEHLIVVSDADGTLLWVEGNAKVRSKAADSVNFVEGALWSEVGAGTNAIGTAVAADHPVQVHAAEHLSEIVHQWTCSAAPVHDPEDGRLLGIIDLTGLTRNANAHSYAVAVATARWIEADLRDHMHERDAQMRAQYLARASSTREQLALVSLSGRVIADTSDGFVRADRLDIPAGGGDVILPSGVRAFAELVDHGDALIVRELRETLGSSQRLQPNIAHAPAKHSEARAVGETTSVSEAQFELARAAEELASLRRVARMVACQSAPHEIFAAVAEEVARLVNAQRGAVCRYERDGTMAVVAYWSNEERELPIGTRVPLEGDSVAVTVHRSGGPARIDSYDGLSGPVIDVAHTVGAVPRATVGAPIFVAGHVWGVILATSTTAERFADDTEARLLRFAELVAAAFSNVVGRAELEASRARIVATADETRRRIERDLHDGAQQRLVALALELRAAETKVPAELDELRDELARMATELGSAMKDLQEIARGIHPAQLSRQGLVAALKTLCGRAPVPVELDIRANRRYSEAVEVAAYYVVSEALTNVAKHASASSAHVAVESRNGTLEIAIRDDGKGGADPSRGSGLIGLRDRVDALGGNMFVESAEGAGTSVRVTFPVA